METVSPRERAKLRRRLRRCGVAEADVDDVLQLVELGAWRIELEVRGDDSPDEARRKTLAGIARRQAARYRQAQAEEPTEPLDPDELAGMLAVESHEQRLLWRGPLTLVEGALFELAQLTTRGGAAMMAGTVTRFLRGESTEEIAASLKKPRNTIYTWLREGRLELARLVKRAEARDRNRRSGHEQRS